MEKQQLAKNLPNLMIPGAQRSGTSYMHKLLSQHPDIYGATVKEVHYFDKYTDKGRAWYESHYAKAGDTAYRLDSTPEYMIKPGIANQIKDLVGEDVKFIFMLRNPVDRLYSTYTCFAAGEKSPSFDRYTKKMSETGEWVSAINSDNFSVRRGLYHNLISKFTQIFPAENIYYVIFEEFIKNPSKIIDDIFNFLGLEGCDNIDFNKHTNQSLITKRHSIFKLDAKFMHFYRDISRKITPSQKSFLKKIRRRVLGLKAAEIPPINPDTAAELMAFYRDDILKLEKLTDRSLSVWLDKYK